MGFRPNTWAKVWEVDRKDRFTKARISISQKNKQTDEYEQSFSGFVSLVGDAHKMASNLETGDRIHITACDVTNRYDKESKKEYTNFTIFSYDTGEQVSDNEKVKEVKKVEKKTALSDIVEEDASDSSDDLPF